MVRKYNASRRVKAAEQTRRDILQAALKLHWEGITAFQPLAREAGCSVATVRKHFPNRESLFQCCTRAFAETVTMPDLPALNEIADPASGLEQCVSELCRVHEAMFGYAWLSAHLREKSLTLDAEMSAYEGLTDAITGMVAPPGSSRTALFRGLLDFLTYRALRLSGRLSPAQASQELITALRHLMSIDGDSASLSPTNKAQNHDTD